MKPSRVIGIKPVMTDAVSWQRGIWDQYPEIYLREVDARFVPVVADVIARAALRPGLGVLDLGTVIRARGLHGECLIVVPSVVTVSSTSRRPVQPAWSHGGGETRQASARVTNP